MISLLVLMILAIYVTIGSKGDEKSKYGYTVYQGRNAITHIDKFDINISTPQSNLRFFKDTLNTYLASEMKKSGIEFGSATPDFMLIQEFYFPSDMAGITEADVQKRIEETQGDYGITSDLSHDDLKIGNLDFHRVCYSRKDKIYLDYGVVAEYFTEHDGKILEIRSYVEYEEQPNYKTTCNELCEEVEEYLKDYSYGNSVSRPDNENLFWAKWKSLDFAPWVLIIPFVYALVCGITYVGESEKVYNEETKRYRFVGDEGTGWNEQFLSRDTSKMLLGFFAIMVVFHHLVQHSGALDAGLLAVLEDFGVGFVGGFFFFSGFGLFESFKSKPDYLKGFLKKRLPTVLVPFLSVNLIFVIYELTQTEENIGVKQLVFWITGWNLLNSQMWYMIEIIILYIIFYLLFRFIKNTKIAMALLFVAVGLMITMSFLRCHGERWFQGEWWYNTTLLFPLGALFSEHKDDIVYFIKRFYKIVLPVVFVLFIVFYNLTEYALKTYSYWSETGTDKGYDDKLRCLMVQCPMVIFFILLVLVIGLKLKIGNKVLKYLGTVSLEIYLIHYLFMSIFAVVKGTGAFYFSVLSMTLVAASLLHFVHTEIFCLIFKKPLISFSVVKGMISEYGQRKKKEIKAFGESVRNHLAYYRRNRHATGKLLIRHIVCIVFCLISVFPVVLLVINATQSRYDLVRGISLLPGGKFAENLLDVQGYMNSMGLDIYKVVGLSCFVSITCTFLGTYIGALCAYGFEFFSFKYRNTMWWMMIAALMMPAAAGCVGFMKMVKSLHMYNHLFPLIMAGITIPSCVYFLRMYLHTLSLKEIIEAARIDGCPELIVFNKIILPIIKPAVLLQLIINFANSWNNTLYQNIVLIDVNKKSISVFLNNITFGSGSGSDPAVYCLLLVSTIPSLVIFILFSHGIVARINLGSIKE